MDQVVNEEYHNRYADMDAGMIRRIQVRPYNLPSSNRMRGLDPEHIDSLISIKVFSHS
jgi:DNA replicative helicase MCM subunit Mcm2 (Cdc46/Mcm family)